MLIEFDKRGFLETSLFVSRLRQVHALSSGVNLGTTPLNLGDILSPRGDICFSRARERAGIDG